MCGAVLRARATFIHVTNKHVCIKQSSKFDEKIFINYTFFNINQIKGTCLRKVETCFGSNLFALIVYSIVYSEGL